LSICRCTASVCVCVSHTRILGDVRSVCPMHIMPPTFESSAQKVGRSNANLLVLVETLLKLTNISFDVAKKRARQFGRPSSRCINTGTADQFRAPFPASVWSKVRADLCSSRRHGRLGRSRTTRWPVPTVPYPQIKAAIVGVFFSFGSSEREHKEQEKALYHFSLICW
jgi:hypothetical protein